MQASQCHHDAEQGTHEVQRIESDESRAHEIERSHACPKSGFVRMAENHAAHHEKEIHGKIAAGRGNRREHSAHMENQYADGRDSAQRVERVKDARFRRDRFAHFSIQGRRFRRDVTTCERRGFNLDGMRILRLKGTPRSEESEKNQAKVYRVTWAYSGGLDAADAPEYR